MPSFLGCCMRYLICVLLPVIVYSACNAQPKDAVAAPEIIGVPPPLVPNPGPFNDASLVSQYIRSIFQDSKGNFWFGPAGQSVVRYDGKTLRYYSSLEFLDGNSKSMNDGSLTVHAIAEDRNGNVWFGTDRGAVKYDGKSFRSYGRESGLNNLWVGRKSILSDRSGNLWVGTDGGAYLYNPSADTTGGKCFSLFDLLGPLNVKDIMEDRAGNIWFATSGDGIFRYDGKVIRSIIKKDGIGDNYAGGMIQDQAGNFWFIMKGGILRYDGKSFQQITAKDGLGGSDFWGIYGERSGIIWITARGATTRYDPSLSIPDPKAFRVFTVEDGINCCVQSMYQDREGNMWWGTGQGLYRFDGERFYQVKQKGPW